MKNRGFSLTELLTVLAIITAVGTFAVLGYTAYTPKARILEAFRVLDDYKLQAMTYYIRNSGFDAAYIIDSEQSGLTHSIDLSNDTKYVQQVKSQSDINSTYILLGAQLVDSYGVASGANYVYIQGEVQGDGRVVWSCGSSTSNTDSVDEQLLPAECRGVNLN